jgi:hypothetical protein
VFVKALRVFVKSVREHVKDIRGLVEAVGVLVYPVRVPLVALRLLQKHESVCRGPCDVTKIETKAQTFRYRSLGSKRNQNVLMCSSIFSCKCGTFLFIPKILIQIQKLFVVFFSKSKTFLFVQKILEQKQNFLMCFNFFLQKKNVSI